MSRGVYVRECKYVRLFVCWCVCQFLSMSVEGVNW